MKLPRRKFLHLATGAAALPAVSRIARAQTYPSRPVRIVVPFAPGGPTDTFGRLMAQRLSEQMGKQFYVENIPGAGGNIGIGRVAKATADGSSIIVVASSYVVNPSLFDKLPYDPLKDFDPITCAVTTPMVLAVHPSLPTNTVQDLVALVKANPGKYSFASGGVGSPGHLVGAQLRVSHGVDLVHVPFGSAGLAIGSAIGGHTPISIVAPVATVPQVKEGKLRACSVWWDATVHAPKRAHHGRSWISRCLGRKLVWSARPGWNPEGNHCSPASPNRRDDEVAGYNGAHRCPWLRYSREHPRGIWQTDCI
jgi:tripartite-type tricarboxylate transporter receptor subunit TctC